MFRRPRSGPERAPSRVPRKQPRISLSGWLLGLTIGEGSPGIRPPSKIPGFATDKNGLRKTYIAVYRQFSTLVHGMAESLHRVVADGPRPGMSRVTVVEEKPEEVGGASQARATRT
jgi:hypothetical protein